MCRRFSEPGWSIDWAEETALADGVSKPRIRGARRAVRKRLPAYVAHWKILSRKARSGDAGTRLARVGGLPWTRSTSAPRQLTRSRDQSAREQEQVKAVAGPRSYRERAARAPAKRSK